MKMKSLFLQTRLWKRCTVFFFFFFFLSLSHPKKKKSEREEPKIVLSYESKDKTHEPLSVSIY